MKIIGLTGSIGMGKSTTVSMCHRLNIPIYDADAEIHKLYQDQTVIQELINLFGKQIISKGFVDRSNLGRIVFSDPSKLRALEAVLHPKLQKKQKDFIQSHRLKGAKLIILDIPLLYEIGKERSVDKVLVVTAPSWIQRRRVLGRQKMTESKFNAIVRRQLPDLVKRQRADYILETQYGYQQAFLSLKRIFQSILANEY